MASSNVVPCSTGSRMLVSMKAQWSALLLMMIGSLMTIVLGGPQAFGAEEPKRRTAAESHALELPATLPPKSSATKAANESPDAKKDWVDQVDSVFGTWLVKPLELVLFYDFRTKEFLGTSVPFVVIWLLFGGVFLTLRMAFINLRGFYHAIELIRGTYDEKDDQGDVSHFQALASALSGTVGLGNIAGVAIAIGQGGPGATFWMIVCGLLGMTSKFSECTLAVMYRRTDEEGLVLGGPMIYLRDGLARMGLGPLGSVLAIAFTFLCIGGSLGGGNSYQVVQSLNALQSEEVFSFLRPGQYPWIYGVVMVVLVGAVIIGGIKSIGNFAGRVVPFMCLAYLVVCLSILGMNFSQIPYAVSEIFRGAFTPDGLYGGFLGVMVLGIKRACFSNEAGAGSAAIAHAAARTKEPVSEGMVALLEPFIDTVVVCTLTALTIVVTGVYRQPEILQLAQDNKGSMITLAAFTQNASFEWFKYILYLAVFLFAYSTCVSWSYYGERCCVALFGNRSSLPYKVLFLTFTFLGSVVSPTNILDFSDMMILSMAIPNLIGVFLLSNRIRSELDRYWARYKSGELLPKHE
ncbi:Amino-acid carrier protein AlsT [Pirellula sp. SH-Sr6A]|uniref:alanine/glycine:cation symporter family protein n=1 Tax=Pirellula sp. SH-Sr6A TaxID=1632865 RepID=UPI00078EE0B6|nr:amino acid carrier protein [Pirellula sp. SH-Sr6A]AMV30686.1 Amino-acid carrier protein AlsT [Pirellula sp. SH-Sr6A]